jgi:REP element-mobilizing transposase RayT
MSNHTHLVLRINKQKADSLSVKDIIRRWHRLYKGMLLSQRYIDDAESTTLSNAEIETVHSLAEIYRKRLYDISWFMRLLNEYIARRANKEDDCTGHFWEGRFKSQALLDEASIAACMAYVDLNPVRACLADTPEESNHTSIQKRISAAKSNKQPNSLLPFAGNPRNNMPDGLPFQLGEYFILVEYSGRYLHPNKSGNIDYSLSPILSRVGLTYCDWKKMVTGIETAFKSSVSIEKLHNQRQKQTGFG